MSRLCVVVDSLISAAKVPGVIVRFPHGVDKYVIAWLNCVFAKIFCASHKKVSSEFSLAYCTLESNSRLRKIGYRSSFSWFQRVLMALTHRPVFADKKVIICVLCFIQFVVYSMPNPVVYRTAKRVVFF